MEEYISSEVKVSVNKLGDEFELEIYQYEDRYKVVATLCEDHTPFRDFIGVGEISYSRLRSKQRSQRIKQEAIKMALTELYSRVYYENS